MIKIEPLEMSHDMHGLFYTAETTVNETDMKNISN